MGYENKNLNFKSISEVVLSAHKEIPLCAAINSQPCKRKGMQNSLNAQLEKRKGALINPNFIQQGYGKGPICRNETSALVPNRFNSKPPYCFTPPNINPRLDEMRRAETKNSQFENNFLKAALNGMLQNPFSQQSFAFKQNNMNPMIPMNPMNPINPMNPMNSMNSMNSINPMSSITSYAMPNMQMPTFSSNINQGDRGLQQYLEMEKMNAIGRMPQNSEHHKNLAAIELNLIAEEKKRIEQLTQYLQMVQPTENIHHVNPVQNIPAWNNPSVIQQLMLMRAMDGSLPKR